MPQMWCTCAKPRRGPVPGACCSWQKALSSARRRSGQRRPTRSEKWHVEGGALLTRGERTERAGAPDSARCPRADRHRNEPTWLAAGQGDTAPSSCAEGVGRGQGQGGEGMSRGPIMSAATRTRQQRRELRRLMKDVAEVARQKKAEALAEGLFDPIPTPTAPEASTGQVLEGHIEGDKVIVDGTPAPTRRW